MLFMCYGNQRLKIEKVEDKKKNDFQEEIHTFFHILKLERKTWNVETVWKSTLASGSFFSVYFFIFAISTSLNRKSNFWVTNMTYTIFACSMQSACNYQFVGSVFFFFFHILSFCFAAFRFRLCTFFMRYE